MKQPMPQFRVILTQQVVTTKTYETVISAKSTDHARVLAEYLEIPSYYWKEDGPIHMEPVVSRVELLPEPEGGTS